MTADSTWSTLALEHGITIDDAPRADPRADVSLRVPGWPNAVPFRVKVYPTAPRPSTLRAILHQASTNVSTARLLLIVRQASEQLLKEARTAGISVVVAPRADRGVSGMLGDGEGRWFSLDPEQSSTSERHRAPGPRPWGLYAVAFDLLTRYPDKPRQVDLAERLGLSQGRISSALRTLRQDVLSSAPDPRVAITGWLKATYPDPSSTTATWMTLAAPVDAAASVSRILDEQGIPHALSGQVAADQIAPWSRPQTAWIWTEALVDLTRVGATPVAATEANLVLSIPADPHILHSAERTGDRPPIVDPWRAWLDVVRSGDEQGADALWNELISGRA